jgi:hypothetical protein
MKITSMAGITETSKKLIKGIYFGRSQAGWLLLIKLPLGYGLNLGTGFSGFYSLRQWEMAKYDYADHFIHNRQINTWLVMTEGGN